ncbi:GNAT family N-acetyltransferase [Stappia sp. ES.058]|uniref:GNAT family N-acetyltransferase n=1 Tax=Stappia sp. ES.058 TaxID=1881061 RepID=UPI00087B5250|nr:GNAT family N-acetyltransferase [Stappia sp. ES.058]SDU47943.1 Protein N-acetyltransferase, RimJ/RimL family [Stappia sp. ES.058]
MNPTVQTPRLTLRLPGDPDIDRLVLLANDIEVARMLERMPHPYSRSDGEAWLAGIGGDPGRADFAIDDGSGLIGGLSLRGLDETPVIGYWLGRPYWGRGYMSEAAAAALGWLFDNHAASAVEARAITENAASLKVLAKVGFEDAGAAECASAACDESQPARRCLLDRDTFRRLTSA